jgi:RNA polymerase-associated protein RTF1
MDAMPATRQELNAARLSRYEIVDMMFKDGFEEVATGTWGRAPFTKFEVDSGSGLMVSRIVCSSDGG